MSTIHEFGDTHWGAHHIEAPKSEGPSLLWLLIPVLGWLYYIFASPDSSSSKTEDLKGRVDSGLSGRASHTAHRTERTLGRSTTVARPSSTRKTSRPKKQAPKKTVKKPASRDHQASSTSSPSSAPFLRATSSDITSVSSTNYTAKIEGIERRVSIIANDLDGPGALSSQVKDKIDLLNQDVNLLLKKSEISEPVKASLRGQLAEVNTRYTNIHINYVRESIRMLTDVAPVLSKWQLQQDYELYQICLEYLYANTTGSERTKVLGELRELRTALDARYESLSSSKTSTASVSTKSSARRRTRSSKKSHTSKIASTPTSSAAAKPTQADLVKKYRDLPVNATTKAQFATDRAAVQHQFSAAPGWIKLIQKFR